MTLHIVTDEATSSYLHQADRVLPFTGHPTCFLYEEGEQHHFFEEVFRHKQRESVSLEELRQSLHALFSQAQEEEMTVLYLTANALHAVNYQEARKIADLYEVEAFIIDTGTLLYGQAFLVDCAVGWRKEGLIPIEIVDQLEQTRSTLLEYVYDEKHRYVFSRNQFTSVNKLPRFFEWTSDVRRLERERPGKLLAMNEENHYGIKVGRDML